MKLGSVISNGAVLQRQQPIRVWGETLPTVLVQAELAGKTAYAKSSGNGEFLLHLPPMEAGGPFELTVSVPEIAGETLTLHDILIGEVWLCSGQSNMSYRLNSGCETQPPEEEPLCRKQEREFLDTVCPNNGIRFITIPMEVTGCRERYFEGSWRPMMRENAPEAFAVAAWFGARLNEKLNVPIGLLCCAWGGSVIETWTSSAALRSNPDTKPLLEAWEEYRREKDAWLGSPKSESELLSEIAVPDRGNAGFTQGLAAPECDDSGWMDMEIPGSWIEQGLGGNGAIWCRMKVTVPAECAGKELFLKTGGIDKHDTAYFNGVEIGRTGKELETQFWNQPRCYRIPAELVRAGENTIAIRAFSFAQDGAFGEPGKCYALCGDGLEIPLAGTWKAKMEYDLGHITPPPRFSIQLHNTPAMQFDSMVRPLLPFAIQGA
ncbi:MAG: hypothetical protein J5746_11080, partial [Victivallales bacterium]|nr:hypothetical protein [Victivallales bacterium]